MWVCCICRTCNSAGYSCRRCAHSSCGACTSVNGYRRNRSFLKRFTPWIGHGLRSKLFNNDPVMLCTYGHVRALRSLGVFCQDTGLYVEIIKHQHITHPPISLVMAVRCLSENLCTSCARLAMVPPLYGVIVTWLVAGARRLLHADVFEIPFEM
jgi:hypothetical protein